MELVHAVCLRIHALCVSVPYICHEADLVTLRLPINEYRNSYNSKYFAGVSYKEKLKQYMNYKPGGFMPTLQVRSIDKQLYEALMSRSTMENRSISQEVIAILKAYLSSPDRITNGCGGLTSLYPIKKETNEETTHRHPDVQ